MCLARRHFNQVCACRRQLEEIVKVASLQRLSVWDKLQGGLTWFWCVEPSQALWGSQSVAVAQQPPADTQRGCAGTASHNRRLGNTPKQSWRTNRKWTDRRSSTDDSLLPPQGNYRPGPQLHGGSAWQAAKSWFTFPHIELATFWHHRLHLHYSELVYF